MGDTALRSPTIKGTYGLVVLLISPKIHLMEYYSTHTRQKMTPQTGCEEYLFLKDDGGKLDCITDMIIGVVIVLQT